MSSLTEARRRPFEWAGFGLLAALVWGNLLSSLLPRTGGPLIGLALYAVLAWRWSRRDYAAAVAGGLAGFIVHAVEVWMSGWSACPYVVASNLVLPGLLVPVALRVRQAERGKNRRRKG